jgi:hypothetical protein
VPVGLVGLATATGLTVGADGSRDMNKAPRSREALEELERKLTRDDLTHEQSSHCREIITLLKAEREDPKHFARYGKEEQTLIISLIERFEGFCQPLEPAVPKPN